MSIEFDIAHRWRELEGYTGKGGVCILYDDVVTSWVAMLPPANQFVPGCLAVDEEGRAWRATGGNENDGAVEWVSYASKWGQTNTMPPGARRRKG